MVDLFRYRKWDLVSKRGIYYILSIVMLLSGLIALYTKGLNLGIDFKGGGLVTYTIEGHLPSGTEAHLIDNLRESLTKAGVENDVTVSPGIQVGDQIIVRTLLSKDAKADQDSVLAQQIKEKITPKVTEAVAKVLPNAKAPVLEGREIVTGTVSNEYINNGVLALIIGSILIMAWIGIRYNIGGLGYKYSFAGVIALGHDILTLIGMFALLRYVWPNGFVVNSPFIAALLTVLGYSIHDTIVIFDRIRENIRLRKGRTFAETVNISLLETMARSVNTIMTVLITLLALIFFGGPTLRDFVSAMLIGVAVGGYSSIFVASQLLVSWSKKEQKVLLPFDTLVPAMAMAAPAPVSMAAVSAPGPSSAPQSVIASAPVAPTATADAVQRARQAGKTAKRKR